MIKPLPSKNPTQTNAWKSLQAHFNSSKNQHLKELFKEDSNRGNKFQISWKDFFVDYSKNRIDQKTLELLLELADEIGLKKAMNAYFDGQTINATEQRAVQHMALRMPANKTVMLDGENIIEDVQTVKQKIKNSKVLNK